MKKMKPMLFAGCLLGLGTFSYPVAAAEKANAIVSKTEYNEVSKTFDVSASKAADGKTIKQIDIAIWSEEDGQDDLKWYSSSDISNGSAQIQFNLANHGNRAGNYHTHAYVTYADGQRSGHVLDGTQISVQAPDLLRVAGGIHIISKIYAPSNGNLVHAVWSEENGQDDLKWYADSDMDDTLADLQNHSGYGQYHVHTYLNQNGKMYGISAQDITVEQPNISTQVVPISDKVYDVVVTNVPDYISAIKIPTWSAVNNQDDLKWYTANKIGDKTYKATIELTNHGFDYGDYCIHVYGQSKVGNQFEGLDITGLTVNSIAGLENPTVFIGNASAESFTVNVLETAMSKRISFLKLAVTSKTNNQRSKHYEAGTSSYGNINQTVNLKDISTDADTYSVTATVVYSDNSTYTVSLSEQGYAPQAQQTTATPRITAYINETNTYPVGQCTWAVKSLAPWIPNYLGNANMWLTNASAKGFRIGSTPVVGAIAVWPNDGGGYGHVAYVTHVESNTRIQVKEANYAGKQYISNFRGWFNPLASTWGGSVSYIYPD